MLISHFIGPVWYSILCRKTMSSIRDPFWAILRRFKPELLCLESFSISHVVNWPFQTVECCSCLVPGRNAGALPFFSFQNRHSWGPLAFLTWAHPGLPMGHAQWRLCLLGDSCWYSLQNLYFDSCAWEDFSWRNDTVSCFGVSSDVMF